jgi:hypothetical protein
MRLQWVETGGGPHLVLPEKYARAWEGWRNPSGGRVVEASFRCNPGGPATDYDRACSIGGWIGVISVGRGQALVLTNTDTPAAYLRTRRGEHFLLRWVYGDSETELLDHFQDVWPRLPVEGEAEFRHAGGRISLMAAFDVPGHWLVKPAEFNLPRGRYRVLTSRSETEDVSLIIHQLRREIAGPSAPAG